MSGLRGLSLPDNVRESFASRLRCSLRSVRRAPVEGMDTRTGGERGERVRVHLGCRDLTNKQTNKQINKQTNKQTHRQTNKQTDKRINRQTNKHSLSQPSSPLCWSTCLLSSVWSSSPPRVPPLRSVGLSRECPQRRNGVWSWRERSD